MIVLRIAQSYSSTSAVRDSFLVKPQHQMYAGSGDDHHSRTFGLNPGIELRVAIESSKLRCTIIVATFSYLSAGAAIAEKCQKFKS